MEERDVSETLKEVGSPQRCGEEEGSKMVIGRKMKKKGNEMTREKNVGAPN